MSKTINYIHRLLFLLVLSGILSAFAVEYISVFHQEEPICLSDCDFENKGETQKMAEADKLHPGTHPGLNLCSACQARFYTGFNPTNEVLNRLICLAIPTPPPERV